MNSEVINKSTKITLGGIAKECQCHSKLVGLVGKAGQGKGSGRH